MGAARKDEFCFVLVCVFFRQGDGSYLEWALSMAGNISVLKSVAF